MKHQSKFLIRAIETYKFHKERLSGDDDWNLTKTATVLHRSIGSICEDIKIAKFYKRFPDEIDKFEFAYEVLEWIRKKEKELENV